MAEIPENSRLFRKPDPPKKVLDKRFGSAKLIFETGKRTSEPGKRASEVAKRTSEIAKRASEIDDRKKRSSVLPSKRTSFDQDAAPSDSLPDDAFVPPFEDSPPLAILSPSRRLSSSQGLKPPKSKTSKPPSVPSKPLASQRRVIAQPGRDVTGSIRRTSVGEGELRPGSRRSSVTRAEETTLDELPSAKNGVEEEERGLTIPGPEESAEIRTDIYSALIDHARDYIEAETVPPLLSPPEPIPVPMAHAPPAIEARTPLIETRTPSDNPAPVENRAMPIAAPATVYESSAGLEKVVVAVRVRPLTERERASQTRQAVVIQGPKITLYEEAISRANSARAPEQGAESARARANRPAESALPPGAQEFTFDLVQNDSELKENGAPRAKAELQEALFQALGQQCLNSALEGYNVTMFAYGQTGAGKSFSMMGDSSEEGAGIIPRMASKLLQRLREKRDAGTDVTLQVTYLEIYREHVRDLLASTRAPPSYFQDNDSETDDGSEPGSDSEANSAGGGRPRAPSLRVMVQAKLAAQRLVKRARKLNPKPSAATRFWKAPGEEGDVTIEDDVGSDVASVASSEASVEAPVRSGLSQTKGVSSTLKIREHPDKGPYVEGLTERHVSSWAEMAQLLEEGSKNRTIAATDMNKVSSRSHTVFTLTLTQTKASEETGVPYQRVSKINLVDLAGSERQNRTNATGARLKESGFINKSLSLLNDVITELARGSDFVPYRNSSLTWLLKESLGGNSKTVMVASISPAEKDVKETLSTLRYANRAKRIKNKPVLNEDPRETLIKALRAEIDSLRAVMQTMAVTGAVAVPGPRSPTVQLEKVAQILNKQLPGDLPTGAQAAIANGPSGEVVNEIPETGLTESTFTLAHSMATRLLDRNGGVDSVPDSPTSSMLTPVEGFSPRGDTWESFTAHRYQPAGRPHADPARGFEVGHVGFRPTSPRAQTDSVGLRALLEGRKKPDLRIRTRRTSSQSDDERAHVDSATETDPLPATATEGTATEPDSCPAMMTEGTETESDLLPNSVEEGTETESDLRPRTASQGTETDPERIPVRVMEGTETEASVLAVSTGSDAFAPESVSEGTEAGPGAETAACSTETLPPPELVTEGTGTEPPAEVAAACTETVPPDVTTEGTDPLPLDVATEGTEMDPLDVVTEGTETDAPTELKSVLVETERGPAMMDEGTGCDVECTDAQNGTERIILCDNMTAMNRVEVVSSWTETDSDGVNTLTDTDGLVSCVSTASGECFIAVNAESATDLVVVANVGTVCETVQTSSSYTETEAPVMRTVASETEPEVEKRIVHVSAPQARRFEGFSSAISSASPFLVQLLVGSDHKTETETENGTPKDPTDLLEDSASNRKLLAGLRVLRQLGIAVDESVLFREAVGEGLTAHALEAEEGGGRGLKASWAVHVLAPGVNSIGSEPAAGFKLPGGLAKEHVEMVLAPPSEGKASNATVIARSIHDAPALLNGVPLPRFAELRNGDCLLLGDPSALGDGSGDAALLYFFNPLCNLPALANSVVSPKTFSPPGTPFPARARAGWTPVGSPGDHESWRSEFKSPLGVLLRPLDVRPHGQEVATWSPADGPMLDVNTWAFILGDELQRSGSVSNETVNAFLEDVRAGGMPSFGREPVQARDPPPVSPVKLPRSPRGLSFTHKVPESPHRSPSHFSGHHPRGLFH